MIGPSCMYSSSKAVCGKKKGEAKSRVSRSVHRHRRVITRPGNTTPRPRVAARSPPRRASRVCARARRRRRRRSRGWATRVFSIAIVRARRPRRDRARAFGPLVTSSSRSRAASARSLVRARAQYLDGGAEEGVEAALTIIASRTCARRTKTRRVSHTRREGIQAVSSRSP